MEKDRKNGERMDKYGRKKKNGEIKKWEIMEKDRKNRERKKEWRKKEKSFGSIFVNGMSKVAGSKQSYQTQLSSNLYSAARRVRRR
jgi:hypothetical protein